MKDRFDDRSYHGATSRSLIMNECLKKLISNYIFCKIKQPTSVIQSDSTTFTDNVCVVVVFSCCYLFVI